ncbi:hypothetical protein [uncultured Corynebacterium sp.]|uniref:hypothetical protein n=1 Tax=uncultured Corynebacterium sp. TaxID=159447 RepID=UPI0025E522F2|nr:hypothetical protein [uncultured Corynebacterium sp.]
MRLTSMQMQELHELEERAAWLDAEIQKLLLERQQVFQRTEDLNMIRLEGLQSERMKEAPTTSTMELEVLAHWLTVQVQRLEEENLGRTGSGVPRSYRVLPGMVPIMVNDDGYCTQLVIHFDTEQFQGMVGFSFDDRGGQGQPEYDEKDHAEFLGLLLMGEYPVTLAEQCEPGEIKWFLKTAGYAHPDNIGDLITAGQTFGAWLHPRIEEIPHS